MDWTLFALVVFIAVSGFAAWLLLDAQARPVIVVHAAAGLAILIPLAWKLRRVEPRVTRAKAWDWRTPLSILAAIAAVASAATGLFWTHAQLPIGYPNGMHLHVVFGIALAVLLSLHTIVRFKLPARRDLQGRRDVLRWLGMAVFGIAALPAQDVAMRALSLPGTHRRFTGSRHAGSDLGNAMPVTNWMFDRPAPIDPMLWRLTVHGLVERNITLRLADLTMQNLTTTLRATLDCTGGWHSTQSWRGVQIGELLDRAGVTPDARFVSFVSATGYRWSLPLHEARDALLATHLGDESISHWHGAPLRLVAPGRRGFMWVKWVTEVRVLPEPDTGQWFKIFTSGFDE